MSNFIAIAGHRNEWEMGPYQRGLVETCLEEGQYESAIGLLDQLRSSDYKPSVSHLRQLIYISLQPACPLTTASVDEGSYLDIPSPSKSARQSRSTFHPSEIAVLCARRLLMSFAVTNSPEALARALPRCEGRSNNDSAPDDESGDSLIGKEAMCISESKSCWNILVEGFIQRPTQAFSTPKRKRTRHKHTLEERSDIRLSGSPSVIGENSWSVLDWLLVIFERDEISTDGHEQGHFSPLLLHQIPSLRSGSGARWDAEAPLSIVFYCLEQADIRRRLMGSRLMTLLINLSSTIHLDLHMFVASVFSRLSAGDLDKLPILLSSLCPSPAVHRFKAVLCQKFLADPAESNAPLRIHGRPTVPVRAQPRAFRSARGSDGSRSELTMNSASMMHSSWMQTLVPQNKHPLPSCKEIQRMMEMNASSTLMSSTTILRVKFELMVSFGTLQAAMTADDKDEEWMDLMKDAQLGKTLNIAFNRDNEVEGRAYRESLESIMSVW